MKFNMSFIAQDVKTIHPDAEEKIRDLFNVNKKVTIYYDMDNTICLWAEKGKDAETLPLARKKGFFRNLKPIDDCQTAIPMLQKLGFKVKIISACIDTPYCKKEKLEWIKEHLPSIRSKDVILCNIGENKALYADDIKNSILIDDYGKNIHDWIEAGGIAIKKSRSNKQRQIPVVRNHMDIFNVLEELGILEKAYQTENVG